jgi:plastocyanin
MRSRVLSGIVCAGACLAVLPAAASAATTTVYAGAPPSLKGPKSLSADNPGVNAFFNTRVTIHAGDSVKWVGLASTFHNVDLPGPTSKGLPLVVTGATVTGIKDEGGSAWWFDGLLPSLAFNPLLLGATGGNVYDGSKRVSSGVPAGPKASNTFKVRFAKPGTYKYFCDVHPGMVGYVVVKPKAKPIPTAKQDAKALKAQEKTALATAEKVAKTKLPADTVADGLSGAGGVELYNMFPATLTVSTGSVVTFTMGQGSREAHTATFGPKAYLMTLENSIQSPMFDPAATYPSDAPTGPIQLSASSHGNGFANTGFIDQDSSTPFPASQKIQFNTPGTFRYYCLIHPFMAGTIIVK